MKKYIVSSVVLSAVLLGILGIGGTASAMTPTLSLYVNSSNSDYVQVTVYGDANAPIWFYYQKTGYGLQSIYLGSTSSSGYFYGSVTKSSNNMVSGSNAYVMINGQQSASVMIPNDSSSGSLSLSQTYVTLTSGQTSTLTAYNNSGNSIYISGNSNSSVATATVNGNQITITANSTGTTVINVCSQAYYTTTGNCASVTVAVTGSYYYGGGSVSLSQNSVSVNVGQSVNVTVSGGNAPYSMYPGTANLFQAVLAGNTLTITGQTNGSSTLNVCSNGSYYGTYYGGTNQCATLSVYVNSNYYNNNNYNSYPYNQDGWTYCAGENQQCNFSGNQQVRYGVPGHYTYSSFSGSVYCSNSTFGDPAYGIYKQCSYGGNAGYNYNN